jgi:hypothetical protein
MCEALFDGSDIDVQLPHLTDLDVGMMKGPTQMKCRSDSMLFRVMTRLSCMW